jgi:hypothetical protein
MTIYPSASYKFTFKIKNVRKAKVLFLAVGAVGFFSLIGCSKSNNSTPVSQSDSVYSSGWLNIVMTVETDQNGDTAYTQTFDNSGITAAVVNDGIVLSYIGFSSTSGPTTDTIAEQALEYNVLTNFQVGSVNIESFPPDEGGFGDLSTASTGLFYRYVIVPGTVLATTGLTRQQLKSMNYTEVTKVLHSASSHGSSPALPTP